MLGFLLYLPTIALIPHFFYFLPIIYVFFIKFIKKEVCFPRNTNLVIIIIIIIITLINRLLFVNNHIFVAEKASIVNMLVPEVLFLLFMYYIVMNITKKDLKVLLLLIVFEALITIIEFKMGKTTFFTKIERYREVDLMQRNLLYFFRPMGLSSNSSKLAGKLFIGLILIYYLKGELKWYFQYIGWLLLLLALVFSFNRTALLSVFVFYLLIIIKFYLKPANKKVLVIYKLVLFLVIFIFTFYVLYFYEEKLYFQFTIGRNNDLLTGRTEIWHNFIMFIENNLLFGNGSYKIYLPFFRGFWKFAHAHNSYLQLLATNGIFIFLLYLLLIIINIRYKNIIFIIPFLIFSMTQYFLFWGISLADIMFLYFLCRKDI